VVVIYQPTLARNIPNSLNIEVQLKFNLAFTMPTYTKMRTARCLLRSS